MRAGVSHLVTFAHAHTTGRFYAEAMKQGTSESLLSLAGSTSEADTTSKLTQLLGNVDEKVRGWRVHGCMPCTAPKASTQAACTHPPLAHAASRHNMRAFTHTRAQNDGIVIINAAGIIMMINGVRRSGVAPAQLLCACACTCTCTRTCMGTGTRAPTRHCPSPCSYRLAAVCWATTRASSTARTSAPSCEQGNGGKAGAAPTHKRCCCTPTPHHMHHCTAKHSQAAALQLPAQRLPAA